MRYPALALCLLPLLCSPCRANEQEIRIEIRNHRFQPAEIAVPAGQKLKLVVENQDDEEEEFESYSLNREKVVPPHGAVTVWVGPLEAGTHEFFGDYHPATAQGRLIAK